MTEQEKRNLYTGILGTAAVHLFVLAIFLMLKIGKVKTQHSERLLIEFTEEIEYKKIEEIIEEEQKTELKEIPKVSDENLQNIAKNTAAQLDEEISTEKYLQELQEELGMNEEIPEPNPAEGDVSANADKKQEKKKQEPVQFKGKTRIEYHLENRTGRLDRPIYRCQGGGTVIVDITVNQYGEVVSATLNNSDTKEYCIIQTAIQSAKKSRFNTDFEAPSRQKGTIKYIFVAQ